MYILDIYIISYIYTFVNRYENFFQKKKDCRSVMQQSFAIIIVYHLFLYHSVSTFSAFLPWIPKPVSTAILSGAIRFVSQSHQKNPSK